MKEKFEDINFQPATLKLIAHMSLILEEYAIMGYVLTVRQLYYQMVARKIIPNNIRSYKRMVAHCANGRKAGLLDWRHLEDTARRLLYPSSWDDPAHIIRSAAAQFRIDRWQGQTSRVLVMVEKEALAGVLGGVCDEYHVRLYPNRGYTSLSYMYNVAGLIDMLAGDFSVHVIYFGDHDPSGLDMDRDIEDRLYMFSRGASFTFQRIALTMGQIKEHDLPPDPAKLQDSRAGAYIAQYGKKSWELDALKPKTLVDLLTDTLADIIDWDAWEETAEKEAAMLDELRGYAKDYENKAKGNGQE